MGFYEKTVVPYCVEFGCGIPALAPKRKQVSASLHGTVLEIGFGSGLNLPYLPRDVTRVLAVDPSERGRRIGKHRIAACSAVLEFVGLDAEQIRAESASADCALCTFTLCTIPDPVRALREVKRILKPEGRLFFLEHAQAPDASVRGWQDRLNGLQRVLCGGCNLNRDIAHLIERAGFKLEALESGYLAPLPKTHAFLVAGSAARAS